MVPVRISLATMLLLGLSGCALWSDTASTDSDWGLSWKELRGDQPKSDEEGRLLKVASVEANIVRRPVGDARIRTIVWDEVDESGPMTPEERQRLNAAGFRVGIAGSSTPWALQSLAKDAMKIPMANDVDSALPNTGTVFSTPVGPSFTVFERGVTRLEVQANIDPRKIPTKSIPELSDVNDLTDVRCVLEVTVEELNSDWAMLNILPQIYYGANTVRLSVAGNNSHLPVRQSVHPLYEQQFRVRIHQGEVLVVGRHGADQWHAGRLFFQPDQGSSATESMLLIRLAAIDEIRGRRDTTVTYSETQSW
ncbi:MAG: hypothetical protein JNL58_11300 [Planctomyces sp.]|nr:hypothetical protein [Planctomyces sp.]